MSYLSTLSPADKGRYKEKISMVFADSGLQPVDIFQISDGQWRENLASWPPLEFCQIYTYLRYTWAIYEGEAQGLDAFNYYIRFVTKFKVLPSWSFTSCFPPFCSGWVQTILCTDIGSRMSLKARVKPAVSIQRTEWKTEWKPEQDSLSWIMLDLLW